MDHPTSQQVSQALAELQSAGYQWVSENDQELREHLARHAPDSATVGSKFSEHAWARLDALHRQASDLCIVALAQALRDGKPLRVEIHIPYDNAGTEGVASSLVCATLSTLTRSRIVRDPGTVYEQDLEVVVLDDEQPFPAANQFIAPAGILWDTKNLGLYTLFPGSASRPFPREEQALADPEAHEANVVFWQHHFFLARPVEVIHALQVGQEKLQAMEQPPIEAVEYHEQEIARLRALSSPRVAPCTTSGMKP